MNQYKNLGKSFLIYALSLFLITLFLNLFYYLNLLSDFWLSILSLLFPLLTLFILSFLLGKKVTKHGFLEGFKLGGSVLFFHFLLYVLGFNGTLSFKLLIYDFIFLLTSLLGSMIGINKKA